ncbi:hypothetical protein EV175_007134, partial [Coemansia sp. RSA 1933]
GGCDAGAARRQDGDPGRGAELDPADEDRAEGTAGDADRQGPRVAEPDAAADVQPVRERAAVQVGAGVCDALRQRGHSADPREHRGRVLWDRARGGGRGDAEHQADHQAGVGARCAVCVCARSGDGAQPRDGGAQGKHHEAVGRAVPAGVPGGCAGVPERAVRRGAAGPRVPADRAGPGAVCEDGDGDAEPVRRHSVGHVRGADRGAWADAVGQHRARCVDLRVCARDGAGHCRAGQGKPDGAAAVV